MIGDMNIDKVVVLRGRLKNFKRERSTGDFLLSDTERSAVGLTAVASALVGSGGAIVWRPWVVRKRRRIRFNLNSMGSFSRAG